MKSMDPCALTKHITFDVLLGGGSGDWRNPDELKDNVQELVSRGRRDINLVFATDAQGWHAAEQSDQVVNFLRVVEPAFLCLRDAGFESLRLCTTGLDLDLLHLVDKPESDVRKALLVFPIPCS